MAFVAQVNLADVSPLDERGLVPPVGLVSFFGVPGDLDERGSRPSWRLHWPSSSSLGAVVARSGHAPP